MKKWHKIGLVVAVLLMLVSWVMAFYYWNKLPAIIPTHFGFNGQPDDWNQKSIWYSFLMPFIQTLILGLMAFTYWKPQYSDMPTTLWLMTMEKHKRDHSFDLIRIMIVGIALWIGGLFTYMTYGMSVSALDKGVGLNSWLLFGWIGLMFVWLIWWTVKVYRSVKPLVAEIIKKEA